MTESNIEPLPIEVRKIQIEDGKPLLYLYLYTNVQKEQRSNLDTDEKYDIYTYHQTQLSMPIPRDLLEGLDITKIKDPKWHQRLVRRMLMRQLTEPVFFRALSRNMRKDKIREIDRKDGQRPIQLLKPHQDLIYLGNPESSKDLDPRSERLREEEVRLVD